MEGNRLSRGLGWLSVGLGLTELTFADQVCRLLAVRRGSGLVRALGVREVLTGLGLLMQRNRRPWLWGRLAGDAVDLSLLGATLRRPARTSAWRIAATAAAAGLSLVDLYAVLRRPAKRSAGVDNIEMDTTHAPVESWRGSGLAEDIGVRQREPEAEVDEQERERRMRHAQEQLGLPDPESQDMHRG